MKPDTNNENNKAINKSIDYINGHPNKFMAWLFTCGMKR